MLGAILIQFSNINQNQIMTLRKLHFETKVFLINILKLIKKHKQDIAENFMFTNFIYRFTVCVLVHVLVADAPYQFLLQNMRIKNLSKRCHVKLL